ncbi:hypothetical protein Hypma_005423 [Hypsizygus marmoreus]|uniref:Uncharacterized protein n=1 Tax=Hypsizygus marmoreus TaxID=39966 RepID=A0A369IZ97_HYPMA|nr:hypothetical protein Hypma_005423 [Hypsizygus marmoreus]
MTCRASDRCNLPSSRCSTQCSRHSDAPILHVSELHKSYVISLHELLTRSVFQHTCPVETRRVTLPKCGTPPQWRAAESHPQAHGPSQRYG